MNRRPGLIASGMLIGTMLVLSFWAWTQIPDSAHVAVHWDAQGRPNGYAAKPLALLLFPLIALAIAVLFSLIPSIEPRRSNLWRSARAYNGIWISSLAVLVLIHAAVILNAAGHPLNMSLIGLASIGVLLVVLGNYMGKLRSNFFVGIRTPWTLSSELSWNKTHRLGGRLFMGLGALLLLAGLVGNTILELSLLLGGLAVITVVLLTYSYVVWRADPAKHALGAQAE
jgi:uncharacterized membrane protein